MSNEFYSPQRQFMREWRVLWRMYGLDTLLGGLYVVVGFYAAHRTGYSQVYNVILPFVIASIVTGYLAYAIIAPQSRGKTLPYFSNLPRARMVIWNAHLAYLVAAIVWMEGIIMMGVLLKLGGAGITPFYRLHPEAFAFPFLVIAAVYSYVHFRYSARHIIGSFFTYMVFAIGGYWLGWVGSMEDAEAFNNYFPPRGFALSHQFGFAALLLLFIAVILNSIRGDWKRRELGEVK